MNPLHLKKKKNIVAPSLLSCDFLNLESEISSFEKEKDLWLHLDIMDGHFVPNLTFGLPIVKKISQITSLPLDAHFMVNNPKFHLKEFANSNIYHFSFHYEACPHGKPEALEIIKEAKENFKSVGISLRPQTPLQALSDKILESIDLLLVMSVEPGFGGQTFQESTWQKLRDVEKRQKELGTSFAIQVDGGVHHQNAKALREHGATHLVAGSYIFQAGSEQYSKRIENLR